VEQIDYGWKQSDAETSKVVPVHTARKAYGGTGGTAPIILNLITRVGFTIQLLYSQANIFCTHQIGGWGCPTASLGVSEEEKKNPASLLVNEPQC
jgi:hypothetical protein